MKRPSGFALRMLLPLALATILSACASRPVASPQVQIPPLPAALMTDDSAESSNYSQRVRNWLKKAGEELTDLLQRKPGCSELQPKSEACL